MVSNMNDMLVLHLCSQPALLGLINDNARGGSGISLPPKSHYLSNITSCHL